MVCFNVCFSGAGCCCLDFCCCGLFILFTCVVLICVIAWFLVIGCLCCIVDLVCDLLEGCVLVLWLFGLLVFIL